MKRGLAVAALFVLPYVAGAQAQAPGNDTILADELRADLFFLASDEMQGRLTGDRGNRIASAFIRSRFERLGLQPMGPEGSFYQEYVLTQAHLGSGNSLEVRTANGATYTGRLHQDFFPQSFSASGTAEGEVVFAGFGVRAPKLGHDDYREAVFRGKVALAFDHEPGEKDRESLFDGVVTSEYSRDLRKALYAQSAGAIALLFVADRHNHPGEMNFTEASR